MPIFFSPASYLINHRWIADHADNSKIKQPIQHEQREILINVKFVIFEIL